MTLRHFTSVSDLSLTEIQEVFELSKQLKSEWRQGERRKHLEGKTLAMIFEKPSLRTRVSFEVAMVQLGGHAIHLSQHSVGLGKREAVKDFALVLSRYVDAIMIRTFAHQNVTDLARWSSVPVINGLSDQRHPCQAMGDLLTIEEKLGKLEGVRLVFVGDGNNVARSLASLSLMSGVHFTLASPCDFHFTEDFLKEIDRQSKEHRGKVGMTEDVVAAVKDADIIYTDVWASMGQEKEARQRRRVFMPYQVNSDLLSKAKPKALVMHCLPAHRGEEITDEVMDGPRAIVYQQAENRLHVQKGILKFLLARHKSAG